jgi:hypothetical protein
MARQTVHDFPVGTYVESVPRDDGLGLMKFVGSVVGITVNTFGEPLLILHMTRRSRLGEDLTYLGWSPSPHDKSGTIWEMTSSMHPSNVRPLGVNTILRMEH